jgi:hypothetical protein
LAAADLHIRRMKLQIEYLEDYCNRAKEALHLFISKRQAKPLPMLDMNSIVAPENTHAPSKLSISVPSVELRHEGGKEYHCFKIVICVNSDSWTIFRRYSELYGRKKQENVRSLHSKSPSAWLILKAL